MNDRAASILFFIACLVFGGIAFFICSAIDANNFQWYDPLKMFISLLFGAGAFFSMMLSIEFFCD